MTHARNVTRWLVDQGYVPVEQMDQVEQQIHLMIKRDYVPDGKGASGAVNLRAAPPGSRCGVVTGHDIQSGPFHCGEPGTLVADDLRGGGLLCACRQHERVLRAMADRTREREHTGAGA